MKTPTRTFVDTAYSTVHMEGHTPRIRKTGPDNLAYYSRTIHHVQFEGFGRIRGGSILEKSVSAIHHIKILKKKKNVLNGCTQHLIKFNTNSYLKHVGPVMVPYQQSSLERLVAQSLSVCLRLGS